MVSVWLPQTGPGAHALLVLAVCAAVALVSCLLMLLVNARRAALPWTQPRSAQLRTMVVLGSGASLRDVPAAYHSLTLCRAYCSDFWPLSGGHTAEMLALLDALDLRRYSPRIYVVAATDRCVCESRVALRSLQL